ncbi:hypothetical protein LWI29_028851 [Acer saccharum]|uniref:Transport inhibitor response 1 domain-containing protein n=1 Tax=Acer saccharum TaxID=4024 RepID=A0AA39SYE9_ACESA|nr:hypothetical protein LWI29_028851 [Acer saccharum]
MMVPIWVTATLVPSADVVVVVVVVPSRGARASFSSVNFTQGLELGVIGVQKLVPRRAMVEDPRVHRKLLLGLAGDSSASVSQNSLRNPKGKPRFSDFNLVPHNWGADIHARLIAFANNYPFLEELRLKRMTMNDESPEILGV